MNVWKTISQLPYKVRNIAPAPQLAKDAWGPSLELEAVPCAAASGQLVYSQCCRRTRILDLYFYQQRPCTWSYWAQLSRKLSQTHHPQPGVFPLLLGPPHTDPCTSLRTTALWSPPMKDFFLGQLSLPSAPCLVHSSVCSRSLKETNTSVRWITFASSCLSRTPEAVALRPEEATLEFVRGAADAGCGIFYLSSRRIKNPVP